MIKVYHKRAHRFTYFDRILTEENGDVTITADV